MISMAKHHKHEEHSHEEHSHEEHKHKAKNYWLFSTIVLAVLLVAVVAFYSLAGSGADVGAQAATDKALTFINNYMLSGVAATVVSTEDTGGLYKISLDIAGSGVDVYVTKNGSLLFPSVVDMDEEVEVPATDEVPKTARPEAHAFIMSYCPYGLQFLKAYIPVIELLGDKADLEINFVHYAMHGEKEIQENNRIYCIQEEQSEKLTNYLRCFVESDDYESCLASTGIDTAKLDACIAAADEQFKITEMYNDKDTWLSGSYPQYLVDAELATQYSVGGSPTFILNGQVLSVTRSADAIKQAVCDAFTDPPSECEQVLNTNAESPGIGPIGSGSGSGTQAQC